MANLCKCQEEGNCAAARTFFVAGLSVVAGAAVGATAMYFCDPNRGKVRRKTIEQEAASAVRRGGEALVGKAEDLLHRTKGALAKASAAVACEGVLDDEVLAGRVRSHMGHVTRHAHAIETEVADGVVTLHGVLPEKDRIQVVEEVRGLAGVKAVLDRLACQVPA